MTKIRFYGEAEVPESVAKAASNDFNDYQLSMLVRDGEWSYRILCPISWTIADD